VSSIKENELSFVGAEGNQLAATAYVPSSGSGDLAPVLLMHGGGQTRYSWDATARQIAERGRVAVAVDARGHGESSWVESGNYTFEHYRSDLVHLCDQVSELWGNGKQGPALIGASMGGISGMLAQAKGDVYDWGFPLFSALVFVDITPRMTTSGVDKILGFMAANMRDGFENVEAAADVIATYLPNRSRPKSLSGLSKNLRQRDDGRWYWHWDPNFIDGEHNITTGRADRIEDLMNAVRKISVPTLLVRGAKSELVTKEAVDEFLELVPHAKFHDINEAGHMVAGDKNDVFAEAAISFLDEVLNA
jgi:pimeloyl-ACP methyl ester carboxylesterase